MNRLAELDMNQDMDKADYKTALRSWQFDLLSLQQGVLRDGARMIINIEGMDAAGKGGAIRRMVKRLDPRGYKVYRIGAPDPREQEKHYLYRFWNKVPAPGELVIFDRSWYGRVLVERVEGFAEPERWQQAYDEINAFERMLTDDGIILCKLWFQVDPDEQLRRFEARLADPYKAWKMTDEDWRNRKKWDDYIQAAEAMFARTDTDLAPWTLIPANSKRFARLSALQTVGEALADEARRRDLETHPLKMMKF